MKEQTDEEERKEGRKEGRNEQKNEERNSFFFLSPGIGGYFIFILMIHSVLIHAIHKCLSCKQIARLTKNCFQHKLQNLKNNLMYKENELQLQGMVLGKDVTWVYICLCLFQ